MQEDTEIPEETELQKRIKRIARLVISVFLLLLMVSYLIPLDIAGSVIEGNKIMNYQVDSGSKTIIFEKSVYEELRAYYLKNQLTEISFCLLGKIEGDRYIVSSFYIPKTLFKTPISVSSIICSQETIITMHTHPFNNCLLSEQDIMTYKNYINNHPGSLGGVMCSVDRFAFYDGSS